MHSLTMGDLITALEASGHVDLAQHSRLAFWRQHLGHLPVESITEDDVDEAVSALMRRGRLRTSRNSVPQTTGQPLKPSTIGRYIGTLQGVFKFARKTKLTRRSFTPPTKGIDKPSAPVDKNKFLTYEEVERLIKWARVLDKHWGKMPALLVLLYHTGLRIGSVKNIRWADIDWDRQVVYVPTTKNGEPITSPLTRRAIDELVKLKKGHADDLVFANRRGEPYHHRRLWQQVAEAAGLPKVTAHWLRHSCGTEMAQAGCSQPQIMAQLGHKTLTASARYMHSNAEYQRQALNRVEAFK